MLSNLRPLFAKIGPSSAKSSKRLLKSGNIWPKPVMFYQAGNMFCSDLLSHGRRTRRFVRLSPNVNLLSDSANSRTICERKTERGASITSTKHGNTIGPGTRQCLGTVVILALPAPPNARLHARTHVDQWMPVLLDSRSRPVLYEIRGSHRFGQRDCPQQVVRVTRSLTNPWH